MPRLPALALTVILSLSTAACGAATDEVAVGEDTAVSGGAAGMCLEGTVDCVDTPGFDDEPVEIDETGVWQLAADAQYYLGRSESELTDAVRIGRRGAEPMALTEDYVLGRMTADLDDVDDDGTYEVTAITVELPDGPETFTLED